MGVAVGQRAVGMVGVHGRVVGIRVFGSERTF